MQGLNVSSPEVGLLTRVVLGFLEPLEYTNFSSYHIFDLLVYNGEPNVVLSLDRSSLGWLESLKLYGARCCL